MDRLSSIRGDPAFLTALRDSLPILSGYVPLGLAFGVLFQSLGFWWVYAPLAGILIYAGSAQFMAVSLIASGVSLLEAFVATTALNSRHIFYGLSLLDRYPKAGLKRWYLIFGLTDETYVIVTRKSSSKVRESEQYYFNLTILHQFYWVIGCGLGAGLQYWFDFDSRGFEFAFVALFLVLLTEQLDERGNLNAMMLASIAAIGTFLIVDDQFLVVAIGICVLLVIVDYKWKQIYDSF